MENNALVANYFRESGLSASGAKTVKNRKVSPGSDAEISARAAWLHYAGGHTQSSVAARLGIAPTRAHRMIARAVKDGLVRIFVDAEVASCAILEDKLMDRYGLDYARVVPDIGDDELLPVKTLSLGGADYLMKVLEMNEHKTIGVGHGRTLGGVVDTMAPVVANDTQFVSLLGGLTRKFAANPHDVIYRLAEKTGAEAYLMPVPMFANSVQDKQVMLQQKGLAGIMHMINSTSLCIVGIGAVSDHEEQSNAKLFEAHESLNELLDAGACAELLGQFMNASGEIISTDYDNRMMAPDLAQLKGREVVAIAGGSIKHAAVKAALKSGFLSGLITDEVTARSLADQAM